MPGYYAQTIESFLAESTSSIVGQLVQANSHANFLHLEKDQTDAWERIIESLKLACGGLAVHFLESPTWGLILEFPIPRRQKRADVIILAREIVFVLEFKGASGDTNAACQQVEDYALDLSDFHRPSHDVSIVPIVVKPTCPTVIRSGETLVQPVSITDEGSLAATLASIVQARSSPTTSGVSLHHWNHGVYHPVPTIIEAATTIFAGMEVRDIAHAHGDPQNLIGTVDAIANTIQTALARQEKVVCFVTGVPGSGKTLAGLRLAHDTRVRKVTGKDLCFMSGNGPLVRILIEALTRDQAERHKKTKKEARRVITSLIQNVHAFARNYHDDPQASAPYENVIIFDEAQRAWNAERNRRKFKRAISEPSMILSIMDRLPWGVIVALVGGGQEIHEGEGGLQEWGRALASEFPHWKVVASPQALEGGAAVAGKALFSTGAQNEVLPESRLHLSISTRSYKVEKLNAWVDSILRSDAGTAEEIVKDCREFPVVLTRELSVAKEWMGRNARGSARAGLVACSGAARLRAYGIETSTSFHQDYPYEHWFLGNSKDVRSSFQFEVAATEFAIQGLELDWVGLCWGGDLIWDESRSDWRARVFAATKWREIRKQMNRDYLLNKYRVLMTRARQGMVIWVPRGDRSDATNAPEPFDMTAAFLLRAGLTVLEQPFGAKA